jgi:hypothetical protein
MQRRGEHNPRHVGKKVFDLPIPLYNPHDAVHARLVSLSVHAEQVAAATPLPEIRFEVQRRKIREALESDGVAAEIDAIVKSLLEQGSELITGLRRTNNARTRTTARGPELNNMSALFEEFKD